MLGPKFTLRGSYGEYKGWCLVRVLQLVRGIGLVNSRTKWLLRNAQVHFDCAGLQKVWSRSLVPQHCARYNVLCFVPVIRCIPGRGHCPILLCFVLCSECIILWPLTIPLLLRCLLWNPCGYAKCSAKSFEASMSGVSVPCRFVSSVLSCLPSISHRLVL